MLDIVLESSITCLIIMMCCPGRTLITRRHGTLAEERPDLVQQWVDEANKDITPDTVRATSHYRATWQGGCSCKHCGAPHPSWQAPVSKRTVGSICPYCSGHKVCVCQSIAALCPDLVKELDLASTPELDPKSLGPSSGKSASWVCAMHGSWAARIRDRTKGTGCPSCARFARYGAKPRRGLLKDECPEIFAQVHPTLNGNVMALDEITCGSGAKIWWLCKEDKNRPQDCQHEHAWQARVCNRCRRERPQGCPFCAGNQVCQCNSISNLRPELLRFWDYSRNITIKPDKLGLFSSLKVWWHHECRARDEEHVWHTSPNVFISNDQKASRAPCPICKGRAHKTIVHMGRTTKIKM